MSRPPYEQRRRRAYKKARTEAEACSIEGCDGRTIARGYCPKHYQRWRRTGDATSASRTYEQEKQALLDRIEKHSFVAPTGCRLWTGNTDVNGFPELKVSKQSFKVHRLAYHLLIGPIPEGTKFKHSCRTKVCVNPNHLEVIERADTWASRIGGSVSEVGWTLVLENLGLCRHIVQRVVEARYPLLLNEMEEFQQYGRLGLIAAAARKPDLSQERFVRYAWTCITNAVHEGFREITGNTQQRHDEKAQFVFPVSIEALRDAS